MVISLALILAVAIGCYTVLPALSHAAYRARWKRVLALLGKGTKGSCAGIEAGNILLAPDRRAETSPGDAPPGGEPREGNLPIPAKKTVFLFISADAPPGEIPRQSLRELAVGAPLFLSEGTLPLGRRVCAFLDPRAEALNAAAFAKMVAGYPVPPKVYDPLKYAWAAIGVFVEFLFFVAWLGASFSPLPAVAAMVAIFGKALPWCPPGLFLTLYANYLSGKVSGDKKKDRRRRAVGHLLVAVGVSVNLVAVFFGIRQTGWIGF